MGAIRNDGKKKLSLVMRDGQVCVLIRYTVGKPLSLEGEGKRVPCLLRENEKTRR